MREPAFAADPQGDALLVLAAAGDAARLASYRERARAGEPAPYITGFFFFRGRRYHIDSRAYITDPELSFLVDLVIATGDQRENQLQRPPHVLEFGTGAGTLLLAVAHERPHWSFSGLDVDPDALALARLNAAAHGHRVDWILSDFFAAWSSPRPIPDLVFGDPPWGNAADLYDPGRDANYYARMPAASAFPPGGSRTGIHDRINREWVTLRWDATLLLNYGILPEPVITQSASPLPNWTLLHPHHGLSVLKAPPAAA